ncbi:radical SAM protein [Campylobacter avium]|uniref:radical SAM protein n=1 Tax=Campylobacter avium TaxID=522485 RepID=UPI002356316E|nr:radical SAM protein [Campylobacter avium]
MYIFGPVNSRRFGLSLGIDLSPGLKQCNYDCVYCELNAKKPVSFAKSLVAVDDIIKELKESFDKKLDFDFITVTANGEPSLYPYLKDLIFAINEIKKDKKVLILSNGSAVLNDEKFEALLYFDVVKFSLDSAKSKTFFKIDRALKSINLELMIEKMSEFSRIFEGELVMEVLVVEGLNDNELEFKALNEAFKKIKAKRVDISSVDRPPAYPVKGVSDEKLASLASFIDCVPVYVAKRKNIKQNLDLSEEELLKLLSLRPLSEDDIEFRLSELSKQRLKILHSKALVRLENLAGVNFYRA